MKQLLSTANPSLNTQIQIPGSKSITNRALLLAALADGVSEISNVLISDDTKALVIALHQLGIMIRLDESTQTCIIGGGGGSFPKKKADINCEKAGTVARFLLAACASSVGTYYFDASEQLRNRPIQELLTILKSQGAIIIPEDAIKMPFVIEGMDGLHGGEIDIESSRSSQFVSALLMIAPLAHSAVVLNAANLVSSSYVEMTCQMMAEFGVLVRRLPRDRFIVPVPQHYVARNYVIEPDLSTASYFFAAAAVTGGNIIIPSIDRKQSKQGDINFLSILEKMGCRILEGKNELSIVGPAELNGIHIDMRNYSDTFMTLAAIAPFAKTPTTITNIAHTRLQESNRIHVMCTELKKLGIQTEEGHDWLKIYPSTPHGGMIDANQDHRIAMSFTIIGLRVPGVEIAGAECVSKTCPEFFKLWEQLY